MVNTCTSKLDKPIYVIKMNFPQKRWSQEKRLWWLRILKTACIQTIDMIDREIELHGETP